MNSFRYYSPTRTVFGPGAENEAGKQIASFGAKRVFLIYGGQSAVKSGLLDRVVNSVKAEGLTVLAEGGVVPNPQLSKARELAAKAKEFEADFILAVGGGSVIDTAKAVAHSLANPETDFWQFWLGAPLTKSTPVGVVLTISAAGSELSNSSVLTNDEREPFTKRGLSTDFNRPVLAFLNPELTMSLPAYQIGAGAADIFMHTMERYFAPVQGNHLTDEIAEGLMRTVVKYGPVGVKDPENAEAMSEIMWCGSLSHCGLTGLGSKNAAGKEGDWSCHQLGMAISALYDSTHGATLTAVWTAWADYVKSMDIARFAQFARNVFGVVEADDEKAADLGIKAAGVFYQALGMPLTLTELLGRVPTEEELIDIARECSFDHSRKIGAFKVLDENDMLAIYKAAV